MHRFIARENIDHYLGLLRERSLPDGKRAVIRELLVAELDKLARDLEHLEFAEDRALRGRRYLESVKAICDAAADGEGPSQSARRIAVAEETQRLLDDFCDRLRQKIHSRGP